MQNEAFLRAVIAERARERDNAMFLNGLIQHLKDEEQHPTRRTLRTFFGFPKRRAADGSVDSAGFDQVSGALG
jgi:hypothetical protein